MREELTYEYKLNQIKEGGFPALQGLSLTQDQVNEITIEFEKRFFLLEEEKRHIFQYIENVVKPKLLTEPKKTPIIYNLEHIHRLYLSEAHKYQLVENHDK